MYSCSRCQRLGPLHCFPSLVEPETSCEGVSQPTPYIRLERSRRRLYLTLSVVRVSRSEESCIFRESFPSDFRTVLYRLNTNINQLIPLFSGNVRQENNRVLNFYKFWVGFVSSVENWMIFRYSNQRDQLRVIMGSSTPRPTRILWKEGLRRP